MKGSVIAYPWQLVIVQLQASGRQYGLLVKPAASPLSPQFLSFIDIIIVVEGKATLIVFSVHAA